LIRLATIEERVIGEPGKVFSTSPEVATGEDGKTYYIKGRNNPTAFSEVVGCRLASIVGLRVPTASVCSLDGELYGGVEEVPKAQRNIRPWLQESRREFRRIGNLTDLFSVIGVDTWLANDDRNMGNVVGSSLGDGRIDVFMIDFEKSRTLAQNPFMGSGALEPMKLWPRDELGQFLRSIQPRSCPEPILERMKRMTQPQISEVVMPIAAELPFIDWYDASVEVLSRRAKNIVRLVEEVWKKN
jgi:hypothetical protein